MEDKTKECKSVHFNQLHGLLKTLKSKIVLFVGAGINNKLIPGWKELLNELLETAIKRQYPKLSGYEKKWHDQFISDKFDFYDKAVLIRRLLGEQYLFHLYTAMYKEVHKRKKTLPTDGTLSLIAKLCRRRVSAVVTYNYDNLLEREIDRQKKEEYAIPIYTQRQLQIPENKLPVYHVHGYLPLAPKRGQHNDFHVVLARNEYYDQMIESYGWQTTLQLDFLRSNICIYTGTSMTDMNMLRIAHHAMKFGGQPQIYFIDSKEFYFNDIENYNGNGMAKEQMLQLRTTLLDEIGIKMILAEDKEQYCEFLQKLGEILQK
jgi:hypothetical protein